MARWRWGKPWPRLTIEPSGWNTRPMCCGSLMPWVIRFPCPRPRFGRSRRFMSVPELSPILWQGSAREGELRLLDQRLLPGQEQWMSCKTIEEVAGAIREMVVRGAPAIGITAAYGMVVAAQDGERRHLAGAARRAHLESARRTLAATRPTAVNLFWVLEQCRARCEEDFSLEQLLQWARQIHDADVEGNRRMGVI